MYLNTHFTQPGTSTIPSLTVEVICYNLPSYLLSSIYVTILGGVICYNLPSFPLPPPVQYVFKVPHADTQVMVSLMQRDPREDAALSSVGGKNFAIGFYIMRVSLLGIICGI